MIFAQTSLQQKECGVQFLLPYTMLAADKKLGELFSQMGSRRRLIKELTYYLWTRLFLQGGRSLDAVKLHIVVIFAKTVKTDKKLTDIFAVYLQVAV